MAGGDALLGQEDLRVESNSTFSKRRGTADLGQGDKFDENQDDSIPLLATTEPLEAVKQMEKIYEITFPTLAFEYS